MANRIDSINLTVAQITDLTQPLSLAQGGVGATTPEGGRKTLGFEDMGIGVSTNALPSLDWQTFDFVPGALYSVSSGNMTNVPAGMDVPGPTYNTSIRAYGPEGGTRHVDVCFSTTTASAYRYYQVRLAGALGSRSMTVRQIWTSADVVPVANGGTGNTTGTSPTATKLATARTLQTNLGSTSSASFDGSANATPGVTGTLGVSNGGTGSTTAAAARTALGAAASGANSDIKSITGLTTALAVSQGGTGGNTAALARKGLELDETATDIDFRAAKVITRETHASGIFASKPATNTGVNGGQIKSDCIVAGVEVASGYLQMLKTVDSTDTTARLTVYQKGTGGVGGAEATKNFDFASNGNFYMDGTAYLGGFSTTGDIAVSGFSNFEKNLGVKAGSTAGLRSWRAQSNNYIRFTNLNGDGNEGGFIANIEAGYYTGGWQFGGVRGGGADLDRVQLNLARDSSTPSAAFLFLNSGTAQCANWASTSDRRVKEDIEVVSDPLEKMTKFHGVTFKYKNSGMTSVGYIAQDVQEALPQAVSVGSSSSPEDEIQDPLVLNVAGVGALHHEAILALMEKVEQLTTQVNSLQSEVALLKGGQ